MSDVEAIRILSAQKEKFRKISEPPDTANAIDKYCVSVEQVSKESQAAVVQVKKYIETIEQKIVELRNAQKRIIERNQDAIQKFLEQLQSVPSTTNTSYNTDMHTTEMPVKMGEFVSARDDVPKKASANLAIVHKLEKMSKDIMNDRLNELLDETERAIAKVKDGADLNKNDIDRIMGCLRNWKDAKKESNKGGKRKKLEEKNPKQEEEKRRKEEEERKKKQEAGRKAEEERRQKEEEKRRQEAEKRRMEELENKRKEEADIKKREEEDRRKKEIEEAERKAEEERRRKEEEERLQKEEELRRKQEEEERRRKEEEERLQKEEELRRKQEEEEERIKREEEEKQRKLEEERRRLQEEAARKREEERKRLEDERREKERLQKEAEERALRQNPNNWSPVRYERECDMVDGKKAYHGGINCVMISPPGGIEKDDIECNYSDEVDSIIDILENDEKPISSLIDIQSTKGKLHSEVPSRIYIPHYPVFSAGEETVVKITIDGMEWVTISPEQTTSNMSSEEKLAKRMAGVDVNDFNALKAIVVSRPRYQTIIVDRPGVTATCTMDRNVKLYVPREAFLSKTELTLLVQNISDEALQRLVKEDPSIDNILSVNTMITLTCAKRPGKALEIDLLNTQKQGSGKQQRGNSYRLYTSKEKVWKFADVEFKGNRDDLTISLPPGRDRYTIMELEMPSSFPKENVPSLAEVFNSTVNTSFVKMIVRQHQEDLNKCVVRIVRREQSNDTLEYLAENGFTEGPGESGDFSLKEGQQVEICCTGNIESVSDESSKLKVSYLSYMGGTSMDMNLRVRDTWKQKDLPAYVGSIKCNVLRAKVSPEVEVTRTIELTISLPKAVRKRIVIDTSRVKFPYYLTSLAIYISHALCEVDGQNWQNVLKSLLGQSRFSSGYRIAKRKHADTDDMLVCRVMLLDWMKTKALHKDKLSPIMVALKSNGHDATAELCEKFVKFQKESLSDAVISDLATNTSKDVRDIGQALGVTSEKVEKCIRDHSDSVKEQYIAVLSEWRESEDVVRHGEKAVDHLRNVCF